MTAWMLRAMGDKARFQVDARLATILGETYRSSEQALKELIDNAWDADAKAVDVRLPQPMTSAPITISDDGTGMTAGEVRNEYLVIANDRRTRKGERTVGLRRPVKGRKGIGKFAGLMVADTMSVEARANSKRTNVTIRKKDLKDAQRDLEAIDLPIEIDKCSAKDHGVTITLSGLNQRLAFPTPQKLRELLVLEYGRQDDFRIIVNGQEVGLEDIPGKTIEEAKDLPGVGLTRLRYTLAEKPLRQSGIVVRVTGKVVGRPTWFGLDDDKVLPQKLLRHVYGELEADGLAQDVTADWGAIIENSTAYEAATKWAAERLRGSIAAQFKREMSLAKARHQQLIERGLAALPQHRRAIAHKQIERVLQKFYGESEDRIEAVLRVTLEAFERDDYWAVIEAIDLASTGDVETFASALNDFGLVDMAVIGQQARRRLEFLNRMDVLIARPETHEKDLHTAIESNLWLLGPEHGLIASNQTLQKTLAGWVTKTFPNAKKRPDLLLCCEPGHRYVLIELKRPSKDITRDDENQAIKYRDDLRRQFEKIEVLVLGRGRSGSVDPRSDHPDLRVLSYPHLISTARSQLEWLLNELNPSLPASRNAAPARQVAVKRKPAGAGPLVASP